MVGVIRAAAAAAIDPVVKAIVGEGSIENANVDGNGGNAKCEVCGFKVLFEKGGVQHISLFGECRILLAELVATIIFCLF